MLNGLGRVSVPAFLSVAQCMQSQGNSWRRYCSRLGHRHAGTTCFVKYPEGQYPITLEKCAPKNVGKQRTCVYEAKRMGLANSPQQFQPQL
jgi:hypothetical protein